MDFAALSRSSCFSCARWTSWCFGLLATQDTSHVDELLSRHSTYSIFKAEEPIMTDLNFDPASLLPGELLPRILKQGMQLPGFYWSKKLQQGF